MVHKVTGCGWGLVFAKIYHDLGSRLWISAFGISGVALGACRLRLNDEGSYCRIDSLSTPQ